jgi:hypothetical protein
MRIAQSQLFAAFVLSITGVVSIFRSILYLPNSNRNVAYDMHQLGLSDRHYRLDQRLEQKYTTTHENLLRGQFSLQLNDERGEDGDNNVQHRGILRVGSEMLGKWPRIRHHPQNYTFFVGEELARVHGIDYAKFVDDKRVVVYVNETILPLISSKSSLEEIQHYNGTTRLCNLLYHMTKRDNLEELPASGIPPVVLNIDGDCASMRKRDGQGSWVLSLFGVRVASAMAKVDLSFRCYVPKDDIDRTSPRENRVVENKTLKLQLVFPWFANHQSAPSLAEPWPYTGTMPLEYEICHYAESESIFLPVDKMADQIRSDAQRMSVTLVGSDPRNDRTHPLVPLDATPWVSNVDLDDAVIYIPCREDTYGENSSSATQLPFAGLVHFEEYTKLIDTNTRSIGIIAQEGIDSNGWCSKVPLLLAVYLKDHYALSSASNKSTPTISVHNNDSPPVQYARMAMAKQTFGSFSVFPLIPIIGTFGQGYYFQPPEYHVSSIGRIASTTFQKVTSYPGFENLHFVSGKSLSNEAIRSMNWDELSKWLTTTNA